MVPELLVSRVRQMSLCHVMGTTSKLWPAEGLERRRMHMRDNRHSRAGSTRGATCRCAGSGSSAEVGKQCVNQAVGTG